MAKRAARSDEFRAFYRAHYGLVLTVAEQRLDTVQAAEDAAADVFQIAWRRYRDDGAALTLPWVYQILRNVVGTEYRRLARARRASDRVREEPRDEDPSIERRIDVRGAIRQLAERDRELLYMAYWEDLTGAEMAEILGTSRGAVRVRLTRARERLRAVLSANGTSDGDARG